MSSGNGLLFSCLSNLWWMFLNNENKGENDIVCVCIHDSKPFVCTFGSFNIYVFMYSRYALKCHCVFMVTFWQQLKKMKHLQIYFYVESNYKYLIFYL